MARRSRPRRFMGRGYAPQKRKAFSQRADRAPRAPRRSDAEGCIKIVIGRSKVRIWNNCGEPITIEDTLQLAAANIYRQTLSGGGNALVVFADPADFAGGGAYERAPRSSANEDDDYGDIPDDVEKWI